MLNFKTEKRIKPNYNLIKNHVIVMLFLIVEFAVYCKV